MIMVVVSVVGKNCLGGCGDLDKVLGSVWDELVVGGLVKTCSDPRCSDGYALVSYQPVDKSGVADIEGGANIPAKPKKYYLFWREDKRTEVFSTPILVPYSPTKILPRHTWKDSFHVCLGSISNGDVSVTVSSLCTFV